MDRQSPVFFSVLATISLMVAAQMWSPRAASADSSPGTWAWPVIGPVTALFVPPSTPFGAGHRGIDIAEWPGTTVVATAPGTVTFAGSVAGSRFVTIDHGGGLESTYSFLDSVLVRQGDGVDEGMPIAISGLGHATGTIPGLHLGVRLHGGYVDPLAYLGPIDMSDFIRLAPLADAVARGPPTLSRRCNLSISPRRLGTRPIASVGSRCTSRS
jgi:murein DD-endopeptidase MepM/ murein hydrolase activator NlpD